MAFGHSLQEGSHLLNTCRLPWGGVTALVALKAFMEEVPPSCWTPGSSSPLPPPPTPSPRAHLSLATPPFPSPACHQFLAQSTIYFRCSSCHMLTVILSALLRFLHWMSALRVGIWSSAVSPTWGAVSSVWGLTTYCDGCMRWSGLGPSPVEGVDWSYWPTINTGPGRVTHVILLCFSLPTSALSPGHKCNFIEFCHVITWAGCGLLLLPAFLLTFDHF